MNFSGQTIQRQISIVAMACALAACGGGGGGDSSTPASKSSGASPATQEPAAPAVTAPTPAPAPERSAGAAISPLAPEGVFISEVGNNFNTNSVSWLEVYNNTGASIDLANYSVRSPGINSATQATAIDSLTFQLPHLEVAPQSYVVIAARVSNDLQNSSNNIYIADAQNRLPYWQGSTGFVELLSAGKTVDFVRFGSNATSPTTAQAWTGPNVAAMGSGSDSYNTSLVRPLANFRQTQSSTDWMAVNFSTPGGPNDVAADATDSDHDGIPDSAKVAGGTYGGMDLYGMGARSGQRDIFIHVDYMDSTDAGITPNANALSKIVDAFRKRNIAVHFDVGNLYTSTTDASQHNLSGNASHKRAFATCALLIPPSTQNPSCTSLASVKSANMDIRRKPVFRYLLMANSQLTSGNAGPSGSAELIGDDFLVTLGGWGLKAGTTVQVNYQAATIMHELGHTLGLRHGGNEDASNKPNYYSVMNYLYQMTGLPRAVGQGVSDRYDYWVSNYYGETVPGYSGANPFPESKIEDGPFSSSFKLDYSDGTGAALDENALDESLLIGRGSDGINFADWNLNGTLDGTVFAKDLNRSGTKTVLRDYNDWGNLILNTRRYVNANTLGVQRPADVSLMRTTSATSATWADLAQAQETVQESAPPAALIQRLRNTF